MSNRVNKAHLISREEIKALPTSSLVKAKSFIETLLEHRGLSKIKSTYINGVLKAIAYNGEHKCYFDFKLDGTKTGRLSCSRYSAGPKKPKGISFHTLKRESGGVNIRKLFVAPGDWWFITSDYSGMEVVMTAQLSGDKRMIQALNDGLDFHTFTAIMIFNKPIGEITVEERQVAKGVTFLILYGGGAAKLAGMFNKSLAWAEYIIKKYKETYPDVFEWKKDVHSKIKEKLYAENLFGRRRHLVNIVSPVQYLREQALRQGVNSEVQSSSSDILQYAMYDIQDFFDRRQIPASTKAQVHDSLEHIACPDYGLDVVEIIHDFMINIPSIKKLYPTIIWKVPFQVEMLVGHSFGDGMEVEFSAPGICSNLDEIENYMRKVA